MSMRFPILCVLALALGSTGLAHGETLRFASGYPNSVAEDAVKKYIDVLEEQTDDELTAKLYSLTLLNLKETSAGVRDGMADAGIVLFPYFAAEYPRINMLAETSMLLNSGEEDPDKAGLIFTGAFSEFLFLHCPQCDREMAGQNQVFLGSASTPTLPLLCNTPVKSLEDLAGKRLRSGGAQWSRWAESVGATPLSMSVNEIYEGLDQGVVDCTIQTTTELSIFRLDEVASDITLGVPGGVFGGSGVNNMNRDRWAALSDSQRRAVLRASATLAAEAAWGYDSLGERNLRQAREQGIQVHEAGADLKQATREFIDQDVQAIAGNYRERHDVQDAAEMIAAFRPLLQRWATLIQDVESPDQLADLYWTEVFSKVDPSTYGQ
ncbi:C4-dicarboxylate TRAP transporter substrate-binding protein [Alcanivorax sp. IO_7]|nr:C4-dicarboxylate TRAP transporter substrate-binding protein [Alcanivorax sp. IO_7]